MLVNIKYKFKGLGVVMTEDDRLFQTPYSAGRANYGWREIKPNYHMGGEYYRIRQRRFSKKQLQDISYQVEERVDIPIPDRENLPFPNKKKKIYFE